MVVKTLSPSYEEEGNLMHELTDCFQFLSMEVEIFYSFGDD